MKPQPLPFPEDTIGFAQRLADSLGAARPWAAGYFCLGLRGDLGAGKTTLARALLYALGLAEGEIVRSPTYTLHELYPLQDLVVSHLDFYRLRAPGELLGLGLELYTGANNLWLVEWPEMGGEVFAIDMYLTLEYSGSGRRLSLCSLSALAQRVEALL